jgi:hypothetical protein
MPSALNGTDNRQTLDGRFEKAVKAVRQCYAVWTKSLARRTLRVEYTLGASWTALAASIRHQRLSFVPPTTVKRQCRTVKVLSPLLLQADAIRTFLGEGGFLKLHR